MLCPREVWNDLITEMEDLGRQSKNLLVEVSELAVRSTAEEKPIVFGKETVESC